MDGDIFTPIYLIPQSISGIGAKTYPEERYQLNCCSTCEVLKINGLPAVFVFKGIYREGKHPDDFLEVVLSYIKDISGNLIDGCFRLTDAECFDEYEELPWENIFFETECVSTCQECVPNPEPAPFITNHKIIYPDFKVNNVDPYKAEKIFCEFGNAFYEKALALKFGVQFCCPTDLMQSTIEHEILKMEIVEDKYACCKDKNPCANCSPTQTHLPDLPPCTPSNGPWSYTYGPWSSWTTCNNATQIRNRNVTGTRQCILPYCSTYTEISKSTETQTQACTNPCVNCIAHDTLPIGTQIWTGCNATVSTYRDGTVIPEITDPTLWAATVFGAWCYYNNDPTTEATYGKLYNWYAVAGIYDSNSFLNPSFRKDFAPIGYHVPTATEVNVLTATLGGVGVCGGKMKEVGYCHWNTPDYPDVPLATNSSGFTGLPGGYRSIAGIYADNGIEGHWWTISGDPEPSTYGDRFDLHKDYDSINADGTNKKNGFSVRFIQGLAPIPICTPSCPAWTYTYTAWSAWSTCVGGTQSRTRTANGSRTCILANCSTNIETSSNIETETQACVVPCVNCVAHDTLPIGTQVWAGCNTDITSYSDLTLIPEVQDPTAWANLTTGAWCYYDNDISNEPIYGKLYNWYAVAGIYDAASLADPSLRKQFAPAGYHVPTQTEWETLISTLGGYLIAGGAMKEAGLCHWPAPGSNATNSSGFTALPTGYRTLQGIFSNIGINTYIWSSTETIGHDGWYVTLNSLTNNIAINSYRQTVGRSVRFIKN